MKIIFQIYLWEFSGKYFSGNFEYFDIVYETIVLHILKTLLRTILHICCTTFYYYLENGHKIF